MTTQSDKEILVVNLEGNAQKRVDALTQALEENEASWGRNAEVVNEARGRYDALTDQFKIFGDRGTEIETRLKAISDPIERSRLAQELWNTELNRTPGIADKAQSGIASIQARWAAMPAGVKLAATALVGAATAMIGAIAALGTAVVQIGIKSFKAWAEQNANAKASQDALIESYDDLFAKLGEVGDRTGQTSDLLRGLARGNELVAEDLDDLADGYLELRQRIEDSNKANRNQRLATESALKTQANWLLQLDKVLKKTKQVGAAQREVADGLEIIAPIIDKQVKSTEDAAGAWNRWEEEIAAAAEEVRKFPIEQALAATKLAITTPIKPPSGPGAGGLSDEEKRLRRIRKLAVELSKSLSEVDRAAVLEKFGQSLGTLAERVETVAFFEDPFGEIASEEKRQEIEAVGSSFEALAQKFEKAALKIEEANQKASLKKALEEQQKALEELGRRGKQIEAFWDGLAGGAARASGKFVEAFAQLGVGSLKLKDLGDELVTQTQTLLRTLAPAFGALAAAILGVESGNPLAILLAVTAMGAIAGGLEAFRSRSASAASGPTIASELRSLSQELRETQAQDTTAPVFVLQIGSDRFEGVVERAENENRRRGRIPGRTNL